ncbi:uncharacterized protein LODBEIA_P28450 [Lodderomyces beijingensis]|uniref:Ribophorin II C-terminal domain-containing protein n=1 Tax=Lodderomyces beijingensis TaxID=1775926 RepID=A0ABP0ZKE8_9ASCO
MYIKSVLVLLALGIQSLAFGPVIGSVSVNDKKVHFGEVNTQEVKILPVEAVKDTVDIKFKDETLDGTPEQIMFSLADVQQPSLVTHFVPLVKGKEISLKIPFASIPDVLKSKESLVLSLVIADSKKSGNYVKRLLELRPTQEVQSASKRESPLRKFGLQPEIHHIFKKDEKTVNAVVPLAFIAIASVLFLGLFAAWFGSIGPKNMFKTLKTTSNAQLLHNISFLISLLGFEFNFVRYYLGQSIFDTLFYGFVLGIPSLYYGRAVLRALAENRSLGKQ